MVITRSGENQRQPTPEDVAREESLNQMTENARRQQEPSRTNQEDPRKYIYLTCVFTKPVMDIMKQGTTF
ncbi:uncharacterized protein G2W53_014182 [Senna tora]|uniref:Uncharacterized protein n=1 Tax=Senna tora TaxID=362788 RepID=A0A834WT00_9FABA|nr:uncharacterized protein G2W53_014182 [Senna tora]